MGGDGGDRLPAWVTLLRAPNPGPMTLDGTNTWVLRDPGTGDAVVVDPGPLNEGHLKRVADHGPFRSVLITHGHHDHVEGLDRLTELLEAARHTGGTGLTVETLSTPGHTADSVCYLVDCGNDRVMLTGDTILGRGTTVVAWPDGDLGAYLRSLDMLTAYDGVPVLPGHGPVLDDCGAAARAYLAHRRERLAQVRAAVAAGADTAEAVVDAVYPDIEPGVRFAAEWSARAQLEFLRRESPGGAEELDPL